MSENFSAQECIEEMTKEILGVPLKALGYKKSARTWSKTENALVKIVNVQLSRSNIQTEAKFTLNLGIYHETFHRLRGLIKPKNGIKEYDCDVRIRIGQLSGGNDHWWTISSNTSHDKVREGLKQDFETHAIPWLNSFHDLSDMLRVFNAHSRYFDAAVAGHLLADPSVNSNLVSAYQDANPYFKGAVESWAKEHGYKV